MLRVRHGATQTTIPTKAWHCCAACFCSRRYMCNTARGESWAAIPQKTRRHQPRREAGLKFMARPKAGQTYPIRSFSDCAESGESVFCQRVIALRRWMSGCPALSPAARVVVRTRGDGGSLRRSSVCRRTPRSCSRCSSRARRPSGPRRPQKPPPSHTHHTSLEGGGLGTHSGARPCGARDFKSPCSHLVA